MINLNKDIKDNFILLNISEGRDTNLPEIKRYAGVGVVKVLAINPTAAEIEKIQGFAPQNEPVYTGTQDVDGTPVPYVRIDVYVQTVPELSNNIKLTSRLSYYLRDRKNVGSQSGKVQVIDEYGRTAWTTKDIADRHEQIFFDNGNPARITTNYHIARVGEEELVTFLKAYLNFERPETYDNSTNTWSLKSPDVLKNIQASFDEDDFAKLFKGDVSDLRKAVNQHPNNTIKVVFGINNSERGQFQDVYSRVVVRGSARKITEIEKAINNTKTAGGLANKEYSFEPLHEYVVEPTDFSQNPDSINDDDLPFEAPVL